MSVTITEPAKNRIHLSVKGWEALHKLLDEFEDNIYQHHGGHRSPALEPLDKLRLTIIEKEGSAA